MTHSSEKAIETNRLTKIFRSKTKGAKPKASIFRRTEPKFVKAVDDLTLEIKKGELFGLLGPNGAGKTTLVKILCTLLPPDGGTASVNGFDVATEQMGVKRSMGTLFSVGERGFFWRLSGYRNLEFFAAIHNVPRRSRQERIMEVLALVGLEDNAFELYQKYSGGMKRKLALARALLPDPPILLLDEPTTGLDVVSSRNIREFIRNDLTRKSDKTVLYTTHFVEEASQMCDRVGIMNRGKLVICDTPEAIRNTVKKSEIIDITLENVRTDQIQALRTIKGVINIDDGAEPPAPERRRLRIQLDNVDSLPVVFGFLFNQKIRLISFEREEPTLEEAFVELTKPGAQ